MTSSIIGIDTTTKERVEIPKSSRKQGLYIIGAPGTGKTGLIENLIIQDIGQNIGICVLDPHGDLIHRVIARLDPRREKDVILLDITDEDYPFGLNLFACSNPKSAKAVQEVVDQVMHVFEKLLSVTHDTPLILQYLRKCTSTLIANPGYTMADIPLLLMDEHCRKKLVANVTDSDVKLFWKQYDLLKPDVQEERSSSILRRVEEFLQSLTRPIVGQSTSTINLEAIMDEGKILLIKLYARLDSVTSLIGSLMVALLLNAAYSRPASKRRQFHLYADEFQRFATEDFATLIEEARKFGIAVTLAHQNRGQLDKKNKDTTLNAANLVVFRVTAPDAQELAGEFDTTPLPSPTQTQQKPKFAITSDPVGWFRQGHRHSNPRVNELVEKYLQPLLELEKKYKDEYKQHVFPYYAQLDKKNKFLKYAMDGQQLHSSKQLKDTLGSLIQDMVGGEKPFVTSFSQLYQDFISPLVHLGYTPYVKTPNFNALVQGYQGNGQFKIETRETLTNELINYFLLQLFQAAMATFPCHNPMVEKKIRNHVRSLHPELKQYPMTTQEILQETIFYTQFDYLANRGYEEQLQSEAKRQALIDNIERHAYGRAVHINPKLLEPAPSSPILSQYEEYKSKHLKKLFLEGLQDTDPVMVDRKEKAQQLVTNALLRTQQCICEWDELASLLYADPIKLPTGEYEDVPVPRTFADMQNEIANMLVGLPDYIAKVKIKDDVEHIIQTLAPTKGLYGKALHDRIARIQAQNRKDGYTLKREDVEDEITKRQEQCSEPPAPVGAPRRKKIN